MKIKEAIKIINSTKTVRTSLEKEKIYFYEYTVSKFDYFLVMPQKANNWDNVEEDFEALHSTTLKDLARVMDVIQRLLDTPVEKRFPEKKYRLRWISDDVGSTNYLYLDDYIWHFTDVKSHAGVFTESKLDQLKKDNPRFAPAIDAMKEEAKEYDRS